MAKFGLGALGAVASGGLAGYRLAKQDQAADEDRAFVKKGRERQQQEWTREDENRRMLKEATQAARGALMGHLGIAPSLSSESRLNDALSVDPYAPAADAATPGGGQPAMAAPTSTSSAQQLDGNDGAESSALTTRGLSSVSSAGLGVLKFKPKMPTEEAIPLALQARADYLIHNGAEPELWMPAWKQAAEARGALRNKRMDDAWARYQVSRDPSDLAKTYQYLDDGHDFVSAEQATDKGGKPVWNMTRRNRASGETETRPLTEDQIVRGFMSFRDPDVARKLEVESLLERNKLQSKKEEIQASGEEDRKTWDMRGKSAERIAKVRADATRNAAQTRVDGQIRISQLRAASGAGRGLSGGNGPIVRKTETQTDGTMVAVMSDGTSRLITDEDGNPRVSAKAVDQALSGTKIVAGSLGGMNNTPEQNAQQGAGLVRGLSAAVRPAQQGGGSTTNKDFSRLWGE